MKAGEKLSRFAMILLAALLVTSCMLPGMIPLTPIPAAPMPKMETNADALIEVLRGGDWVYLQALAEEQYAEEDFAGPGRLTFTVNITDETPTYFNYGWCTTTEEILQQNFEHIRVRLYFNGDELGEDVVHSVTFTRPDGLVCLDFGVLMSEWPAGEYQLETVVTFEEKINDGLADYEAGDYVFEYNVIVPE